jgi:hypothetical protein
MKTKAAKLKQLEKEYNQPLKLTIKSKADSKFSEWITVIRKSELEGRISGFQDGRDWLWEGAEILTSFVHLREGGQLAVKLKKCLSHGNPGGVQEFVIVKMESVSPEPEWNELEWKCNTTGLLKEIGLNPTCAILSKPLMIFAGMLAQVATRASQLNDPLLNALMARLALYEVTDPYSKEYDKDLAKKTIAYDKTEAELYLKRVKAAPDMQKAIEAIRDCTTHPIDIPPMLYNNLIASLNKATK